MTTTDEALTEQIARAMWSGFAEDQGYKATWEELPEHVQGTYLHAAAAVLPIIRKAQAEAWREGFQEGYCLEPRPDWANAPEVNPYRTEETTP